MLSALASLGCCRACPPAAKVCSVASLPAAAAWEPAAAVPDGALPPMLKEGLRWKEEKEAALRSRCSTASCARCRRTYTSSAAVAARLATVRPRDTPAEQGGERGRIWGEGEAGKDWAA